MGSNIHMVVDHLDDVAKLLSNPEKEIDRSDLKTMVTMGELCIAKSHAIRALRDQQHFAPDPKPANSKDRSSIVKAAELEIEQARAEARIEQYRYDTSQAIRHLIVARVYLESAEESGEFEPISNELVSVKLPDRADALKDLTARSEDVTKAVKKLLPMIKDRQSSFKTLRDFEELE